MAELTLYLDETGNRLPDKKADQSRAGRDWFAIGGVIIDRLNEATAKAQRDAFAARWGVTAPFHMTDMLGEHKRFSWLGRLSESDRTRFWIEYRDLLFALPVLGFGCVIDRPGYVARGYIQQHGGNRWLLCRSAFDICVERACKYAMSKNARLRVVFESDAPYDPIIKGYFRTLKQDGLAFNTQSSGQYSPLTQAEFATTLTTIETKKKENGLLQVADSYLYSIARGKYDAKFHVWRHLRDTGKIINFACNGDVAAIRAMGIKYYCFDQKK